SHRCRWRTVRAVRPPPSTRRSCQEPGSTGRPLTATSWCSTSGDRGAGRAEQADLNRLVTDYASKGVIFLGVDVADNNPAAIAYERDLHVAYPSVSDSDEVISSEYNVLDPPTVIIIDTKGNIVGRSLGTLVGVSDDLARLT